MTIQQQAAEIDRKVRAGILTQRQAIDMKQQLLPKRRATTLTPLTQAAAEALRRRTPAQVMQQLRRDFGDERRNTALWDTLPEPVQRHWALNKRAAGETLNTTEKRAADVRAPRERMTVETSNVVTRRGNA